MKTSRREFLKTVGLGGLATFFGIKEEVEANPLVPDVSPSMTPSPSEEWDDWSISISSSPEPGE